MIITITPIPIKPMRNWKHLRCKGGSVLELVQMRIVFSMMDGRRELSLTYLSVATERVKCLISIPDFFRLN